MTWTFHDAVASPFTGAAADYVMVNPAITVGDHLFLACDHVFGAPVIPAGWADFGADAGFATGAASFCNIYDRIADGSEGATTTLPGWNASAYIGWIGSYSHVDIPPILSENVLDPNTGVQAAHVIAATPNILRLCIWSFETFAGNFPDAALTTRVYQNNDADFGHSLCLTDEALAGTVIPVRTPTVTARAWGEQDIFAGTAAGGANPGFGYGANGPYGP